MIPLPIWDSGKEGLRNDYDQTLVAVTVKKHFSKTPQNIVNSYGEENLFRCFFF